MQVSQSGSAAPVRGEPSIHPSASVHRFSNVVGPVTVGKGALLGPGTSLKIIRRFNWDSKLVSMMGR